MKRYAKPFAFVLAVLMAAALPLAAFAAYGTATITGDNVVYEAIKNSTNPKGQASLRVTNYGSVPDHTLAGLDANLCYSNGAVFASSSTCTVSVNAHGFSLSASVSHTKTPHHTRGDYYYLGTSWTYTSTGVLQMISGSFD
ncbi:MAG: hypothetical protein IKS43_07255 [Clostridia bacterium]|nr:hypothetical protein [Clostridia bacterium]